MIGRPGLKNKKYSSLNIRYGFLFFVISDTKNAFYFSRICIWKARSIHQQLCH